MTCTMTGGDRAMMWCARWFIPRCLSLDAHLVAVSSGLSEDQVQIQDVALDFARQEMLPHAERWDEEEVFPKDVLRELAGMGFAGAADGRESVGGETREDTGEGALGMA